MARRPKRYKGALARPRRLSAAEIRRATLLAKGLATDLERLAAEHDAFARWSVLFEELCAEYGLDPDAPNAQAMLLIRLVKRHVPAARDLAVPGRVGRPGDPLADRIDRMLEGLKGRARSEALKRIARLQLSGGDGLGIPEQAVRQRARRLGQQNLQRAARRKKR